MDKSESASSCDLLTRVEAIPFSAKPNIRFEVFLGIWCNHEKVFEGLIQCISMWMSSHYVKKALKFLRKADISVTGAWIDCGCGHGTYSKALALLGADPVIAIDSRISLLNSVEPPVCTIAGDCRHLPVRDGTISGFLYVNVLHYYKRPYPLIREALRTLRNGGFLLIIEYEQFSSTAWDPFPLTLVEIKTLIQGMDIVKTTLVDTGYRPKYLVVGKKVQC